MDPASIVRKGCPVKLVCPQDGKAILWTGLAVGDRNRSVSDGGTDVPANEFPSSWRNELMRFPITLTAATDDRPTSGLSIDVIERDDDTHPIDDHGLRLAGSKRLLPALQRAAGQTTALDGCPRPRACQFCDYARPIQDNLTTHVRY